MRKLIVSNFVTIDGYYEGKDRSINSLMTIITKTTPVLSGQSAAVEQFLDARQRGPYYPDLSARGVIRSLGKHFIAEKK